MSAVVASSFASSDAQAMVHPKSRRGGAKGKAAPPVSPPPPLSLSEPKFVPDPMLLEVRKKTPHLSPTLAFVHEHSDRVRRSLLFFRPEYTDPRPLVHLTDENVRPIAGSFVKPARAEDLLEQARERDQLLLFRDQRESGQSVSYGVAMFGTMTMLAAHAPKKVRAIFSGPIHLGPAIFDSGAMGVGIAGVGL